MPNRAVIQIHIFAAPIYNRCIISAYALSDFDSTIMLCEHRQMHLTIHGKCIYSYWLARCLCKQVQLQFTRINIRRTRCYCNYARDI